MSYIQKMKGKQDGVSLISLVVTIVVIIILASITIITINNAPERANYSKFASEIRNLEQAIENSRTENSEKGDAEEKVNAGFRKVKVINAPIEFESFDKVGVDVTGYVVDLKFIDYNNAVFGKNYSNGLPVVEFLKDDIYVYDSTGTVYYAKGILYQDEIIHTILPGNDLNVTSSVDGPFINNITITSGELADGTPTTGRAKVIISASPRYGGELKVILRNIECEKTSDGTYVAQVSKNGVYTIVVTEENGGRTVGKANVTEIVEQNIVPSNLSMIVNNGERYTVNRVVDIALRADGASKMMIVKDSPLKPAASNSGWVNYETNIEYDLGNTERTITIYAWFKDDFGNVTDQIVKGFVIYDRTPPTKTPPTVIETGPYILMSSNQVDNISSEQFLLSKTEYGYKAHTGNESYEDEYIWSNSKIIGPLENKNFYDFATRTQDEAGHKSVSEPTVFEIDYDYIINFDLQGGSGDFDSIYAISGTSVDISIDRPTRQGYDFVGWSENSATLPDDTINIVLPGSLYTPTGNEYEKTLYAIWRARFDTPYKVKHFVEKEGTPDEYELVLTENLVGETDKLAYAFAKTDGDFVGLEENQTHSNRLIMARIMSDGSTELRIYYFRGRYRLTVTGEHANTTGSMNDVQYGAEILISAFPENGYSFEKWVIDGESETSIDYVRFVNENGRNDSVALFKMRSKDTILIAKTILNSYSITYELNGGSVAVQNPTEYTKETAEFTLNNPTRVGYEFDGWTGTELTSKTTTVTLNPSTMTSIMDRHYEAHYVPRSDLLTINALPTTLTNGSVTATISCLDSSLKIEYRIGNSNSWNSYVSPLIINENTTIYARAVDGDVVIDEEVKVITNIDNIAPEIENVFVSNNWNTGEKLLVEITATDNNEVTGYSVTTNNSRPEWDRFFEDNKVVLEEGVNYIWVRDEAGNTDSYPIYVYDISENGTKSVFVVIKGNTLEIVGAGVTKSYQPDNVPYRDKINTIEKVVIGEGITSIGNNVLASMRNVKEFQIPSTLQELKEDAMLYSNNYDNIIIAPGNRNFTYENYTLFNEDKTTIYMHSDKDLTERYVIPSSVTTIGKAAFYDNNHLNTVVTTSNPELKDKAFESCNSLYKVEGQIGGTSIGKEAFVDCTSLSDIVLSTNLSHIDEGAFKNTESLTVLEIPKSVLSVIDENASSNGVFKNIGITAVGGKGIVKYYQSCDIMNEYANKYSTEAQFVMIDDIPPKLLDLSITSPVSGTYSKNEVIEFLAEYDENLDDRNTSNTFPNLVIRIGTGSEINLGAGTVENNKIKYSYTIKENDEGQITLVSYNGVVSDLFGNTKTVNETQLNGSNIVALTAVELTEGNNVTYYSTLQKAVNAARINNGEPSNIRLLKDRDEQVTINANKNIMIQLDEKTLSYSGTGPVITNMAILQIYDYGTIESANTLISNEANSTLEIIETVLRTTGDNSVGIINKQSAELTINAGRIEAKDKAIESNGNLNVEGATIETERGPAIDLQGNTVATFSGAVVTSNSGTAVNVTELAEFTSVGGRFSTNTGTAINNKGKTTLNESAVVSGSTGILSTGNLTINNAQVTGTDGTKYAIENRGTTLINEGIIMSENGTVISNIYGTLTINGGTISAKGTEDAVVIGVGSEFVMTGGKIIGQNSRAIDNNGTTTISNNALIISSGIETVINKALFTMSSGEIVFTEEQGVAFKNAGTATITGGKIETTFANGSGIGISNSGTVEFGDNSNEINPNTPRVSGSELGYYSDGGIFKFYDGTIEGNIGKAISGDVTDKPADSYIKYTINGNRESAEVRKDTDKPTNVSLTASTTAWTNREITLTGYAEDSESGVEYYAITNSETMPNDNEWTILDTPVNVFTTTKTVSESNTYYLHVKDQVGNYEKSSAVTTKYDNVAPVIESVTLTPSIITNQDVNISFVAVDGNSGVNKYEFTTVYHDENIIGDASITVSPSVLRYEGSHIATENVTLYLYIHDEAGNGVYRKIIVENIDKNSPTLDVNFERYNGANAEFTLTANDVESGIRAIYKNGVEIFSTDIPNGKVATDVISNEGNTEYKTIDGAGNETIKTIQTYSIKYVGYNQTVDVVTHFKVKDIDRTIIENPFTREGYAFVGWSDGEGTTYLPGSIYSINESKVLNAIWNDTVAPTVLDVTASPEWIAGSTPMFRIDATDNEIVVGYAITTTTVAPTTWSASNDVEITLGANTYYAWAKDAAGNMAYMEFKAIDLSRADTPNTVVGIIKSTSDTEVVLSIEGNGKVKDSTTIGETFGDSVGTITDVVIKDGVTGIGSNALAGLTNVDSITIGSTVTEIAIDAFVHTNNYTTITSESSSFDVENGILISADGTKVYVSSTNATTGAVTLPATVTEIAPYVFENSNVTSITIPNNIDIPEGAFYNATNAQIIAPNEIGGTSIGAKAFYGAENVTGITISKDVTTIDGDEVFTNIGINANTDTGKGYVYYYDSCDAMLDYATDPTTMNQATFVGIDDIKPVVNSVVINNGDEATNNNVVNVSITATDNRAVEKMYITESDEVITSSSTVTWVDFSTETTFELSENTGEKTLHVWVKDAAGNISEVPGTDSITFVNVTFKLDGDSTIVQYVDTTGKDYYEYREPGFTVTGTNVDVSVNGTVNHEVVGTYNLNYVMTYNGMYVDTASRSVEIIPNTWNTAVNTQGDFKFVTHTTGQYAKVVEVINANTATAIDIPNTVTISGTEYRVIDVGNGTNSIAASNTSVTTVRLPNNIIAVSDNAFATFTQLNNIVYGNNLMTIGVNTFANSNRTYANLVIKNNVREVKNSAFKNTDVHSITIENGVKAIYEDAFYKVNSTSTGYGLTIPESIDYIGVQAFYGSKIDYIEVATSNAKYSEIDQLMLTDKNKTTIYQYALNATLTSVTVPNNVENIENGAFAEAKVLTGVSLPTTITRIGNAAFKNSTLESFVVPTGVTHINPETFKNTNISKMYIPENVQQIDSEAFANSSRLSEVIFEDAVSMSGNAFKDSAQLQYVLVFDNANMINAISTIEIGSLANVYVVSETLERTYESDTRWSQLGADRIHTIAKLNGDSVIELLNGASYVEQGLIIVGEAVNNGTSSRINGLTYTITSDLNESVNGTYTVTYEVKYLGETKFTLTRTVKVRDTIPPTITNIVTDDSWVSGTSLKLNVTATDNYDANLEYTVTTSEDLTGATWSTSNIVTVSPGTKYISVRDSSGNTTTRKVDVWDVSMTNNQSVIAYMVTPNELVITGQGATKDYTGYNTAPWNAQTSNITSVVLEEGIDHLGAYILSGMENVATLTIPNSLADANNIDSTAFARTNNYQTLNISASNTALSVDANGTVTSQDGERIFMHSRRSTSTTITIGPNVKYISDSAFYMSSNLNEVTLSGKVDMENSAFENCLNLSTINGEIGNTTLGNDVFKGDALLENITISKTVTTVGTGMFVNVPGIVYYYASCNAMRNYEATYPVETRYQIIDDVGSTGDMPTLQASSAMIKVTSNQTNELSTITRVEYNWRKTSETFDETRWQDSHYIIGLDADTEYVVITRATDSSGNVVVSQEATIRTEKVPDSINMTPSTTAPTNENVSILVEWPVEDMNRLYQEGWPAGTNVIKQIGVQVPGTADIVWRNIENQDATHIEVVTENGTTVYARLYDGYNYTVQTVSLTVLNIDRIAPTGSVVINNGAEETYVRNVTLTLNARDNRNEIGYGVKYYYASENSTADLENVTWNTFNGNGNYQFELSDGTMEKIVYVWYKDAAGNISTPANDSILLVLKAVRLDDNGVVTYYDTIQEAVNVASVGTANTPTITLMKHIPQENGIQIPEGKKILIDMNGKNVSSTSTTDKIGITNKGTLTIINNMTVKSTIAISSNNGNVIAIQNRGLLDITGVSVNAISTNGTATAIENLGGTL